jgi:hypothetical protein
MMARHTAGMLLSGYHAIDLGYSNVMGESPKALRLTLFPRHSRQERGTLATAFSHSTGLQLKAIPDEMPGP